MEDKKLFLIDAYAIIYRAFYALIRSPRVTSRGFNTSAIFGFCNTLDEVMRKENPAYIAVCFDPPGGHTLRNELFPEYKAQRDKQPEDITAAIPYIKRILEARCIPVIEREGYEADDVIGTLARKASERGFTTYMMTPDKDYGQLVDEHTFQYRPSLGGQGFEIRGPQEVCERYGISSPRQVVDLLALEGDASDNVPGCPGVGEKTAAKLIAEWGSVENLLEHAAEVKGAVGRRLADNIEQIRLSKVLVTINTDVPLDVEPESLRRCEPDIAALRAIYDELEFRTLAARLGDATTAESDAEKPAEAPKPAGVALPEPEFPNTPEEIADFLRMAVQAPEVGLAASVIGDEAMTAMLNGLAVSASGRTAYIAMPDFEPERAEVMNLLQPLMASTATLVCHNVKFLSLILRRMGVEWTAPYFDTSVAHYLLAPEMKHDISTVALAILGHRTADYDLPAKGRAKTPDLRQEALAACERSALVTALRPHLTEDLAREDLLKLYTDIEEPFIPVLADMEWEGVTVDVAELHAMSRRLGRQLAELEEEAYTLAGTRFNVGSPAQVGQVLFERLAIDPSAKRTKRGAWSTTEEILEKYAREHPIVALILRIRGLKKLLATYIDALPTMINPRTGRIHTTFNQIITATGRISSTNPNLQNIPVRTDDGREIRRAFTATEGCLILSADYSQIELRLIADISGDPEMIGAFNAGEDIHRATAAKIYHENLEEVTDIQRHNAKTANFGIIYGISAFGLSERLSIPRSEAKALIDGYMATYPRVRQYMDECIAKAREKGFVTTIHGRKRFLPDINSRNAVLRGYAERNAVNAPLQGSAADIIKIAMIDIHGEIRRRGLRSRMIMQVHDELIFNVVPEELAELQAMVTEKMEDAYHGRVTLEVSAGTGRNWLEAH